MLQLRSQSRPRTEPRPDGKTQRCTCIELITADERLGPGLLCRGSFQRATSSTRRRMPNVRIAGSASISATSPRNRCNVLPCKRLFASVACPRIPARCSASDELHSLNNKDLAGSARHLTAHQARIDLSLPLRYEFVDEVCNFAYSDAKWHACIFFDLHPVACS